MAHRYLYADAVAPRSARPGPAQRPALTADQAAKRFTGDSERLEDGFAVGLLDDDGVVIAWLEMAPGARRAVLKNLTPQGSVTASFEWDRPDATDAAVFLRRLTWFAYPSAQEFFEQDEAVGTVSMRFDPDGRAVRERTTSQALSADGSAETSTYDDVDVTPNWLRIPEFGEWDDFFHPTPVA